MKKNTFIVALLCTLFVGCDKWWDVYVYDYIFISNSTGEELIFRIEEPIVYENSKLIEVNQDVVYKVDSWIDTFPPAADGSFYTEQRKAYYIPILDNADSVWLCTMKTNDIWATGGGLHTEKPTIKRIEHIKQYCKYLYLYNLKDTTSIMYPINDRKRLITDDYTIDELDIYNHYMLHINDSLINTMQKDSSMLLRFADYYKKR